MLCNVCRSIFYRVYEKKEWMDDRWFDGKLSGSDILYNDSTWHYLNYERQSFLESIKKECYVCLLFKNALTNDQSQDLATLPLSFEVRYRIFYNSETDKVRLQFEIPEVSYYVGVEIAISDGRSAG
jgi:hypothetical protein